MQETSNLVQIHDEFNTLCDSFGLYKPGGGSYDRSLMNSIYNGDSTIARTTIKSNVSAKNPRLSIISAGHIHKVMDLLEKEKQQTGGSDGFILRFIFCAPESKRVSLIKSSVVNKVNTCNLLDITHLLEGVYVLNENLSVNEKNEFEYLEFDEDAFNYLSEVFDSYDRIAFKYQLTNSYIR